MRALLLGALASAAAKKMAETCGFQRAGEYFSVYLVGSWKVEDGERRARPLFQLLAHWTTVRARSTVKPGRRLISASSRKIDRIPPLPLRLDAPLPPPLPAEESAAAARHKSVGWEILRILKSIFVPDSSRDVGKGDREEKLRHL